MRQQMFRPAAAGVAAAAVALALCGGSGAAAARAPGGQGGKPVTAGTGAATAAGQGCVTLLTLGPRVTGDDAFRTLSTVGSGHGRPAAGSLRRAGWRHLAQPGVLSYPRAPAGSPRPAGPMYTVTVDGTGIAGRPAGGPYDQVFLFNADNSAVFDNPLTSIKGFTHGVARFRVPAGHYWAIGGFTRLLPQQRSFDEYLDVLPQVTVGGDITVHLAAAAATSPVRAAVARPAIGQYLTFQVIRSAAAGPPVSLGWILSDNGPKQPLPSLFVSPTSASPTVGKLATATAVQLGSAVFPSASRYLYDVAYQSTGTIPPQQHVVNQAALATVHLHYYSAPRSAGLSGTFPALPVNRVCSLGGAVFGDMRFPAEQTVYQLASPAVGWQTQFIQNQARDFSGGQVGPVQAYLPGQVQAQSFGAYPLHPAPNVRLGAVPGQPPVQVSAGRAGNVLRLAVTAFSDSVPGHLAQGTFPPVKTSASYQIDQNGTTIAGGAVPNFFGPFTAAAALRPAPSTIRFTLSAAQSPKLSPLSVASHTVWTWRTAPAPGATLPEGWTCLPGGAADRACAVQPMMTLRYTVVGLALDGSAAPGQQVVRVQAGHLPLARAAKITGAAVSVSFDGGKTWRPARVTGRDGSYAAVFPAPPGAVVTLRTSASDAAGGTVTETITDAYQVSS